jgi:transposase
MIVMASYLSAEQRVILSELVATHADATPGQLVKMFQARTGRKIGRDTARKAKKFGPVDYDSRGWGWLSPKQIQILREVIAEVGPPDYCRAEIASEFTLRSGRSIAVRSVSRFLIEKMGFPHRKPKEFAPNGARWTLPERIEAAGERKREREPDRRLARTVLKENDRI